MQTELYEEGGLIIPFFQNLLDAYSTRVVGFVERANTLNLDHFGRGLEEPVVRRVAPDTCQTTGVYCCS